MGDGFMATFDGPARGIQCALAVSRGVEELGISVRQGLHTGECGSPETTSAGWR
jgi:class 3 adenylate cyclase